MNALVRYDRESKLIYITASGSTTSPHPPVAHAGVATARHVTPVLHLPPTRRRKHGKGSPPAAAGGGIGR